MNLDVRERIPEPFPSKLRETTKNGFHAPLTVGYSANQSEGREGSAWSGFSSKDVRAYYYQ